jgi:hypothetical protein
MHNPQQQKKSITDHFINRMMIQAAVTVNFTHNFMQNFIQFSLKVTSRDKLPGTISVDLSVTDQLFVRYSAFIRHWRKNGNII